VEQYGWNPLHYFVGSATLPYPDMVLTLQNGLSDYAKIIIRTVFKKNPVNLV
jgi:hypothetical protein